MQGIRVLVSVPNEGYIDDRVAEVTDRLILDPRYQVTVIRPKVKPYENNLCKTVNRFLEEGQDFWINIDYDNPPLRNPLDLVLYDLDIVGFPTPIWGWGRADKGKDFPVYWNAFDRVEDGYKEHTPRTGLQRVNAIGSGCFIAANRVFQKPEMRKAPFSRVWNEDGTMRRSADLEFCRKAESCGFEVYSHYDYPCDHIKKYSTMEIIDAFECFYNQKKEEIKELTL